MASVETLNVRLDAIYEKVVGIRGIYPPTEEDIYLGVCFLAGGGGTFRDALRSDLDFLQIDFIERHYDRINCLPSDLVVDLSRLIGSVTTARDVALELLRMDDSVPEMVISNAVDYYSSIRSAVGYSSSAKGKLGSISKRK